MDETLHNTARAGDVQELYRLIQRNGNALREIDEVEFINTPLHIAAAEGCIDLAMEIMNLKPSFAKKLNPDGLSPMHVAVIKGHKEMALRFLEIDGGLVRVRGKKGKTPLYHICKQGNTNGLLENFLEICPESIRDVTTKNQTALHIAVEKNKLDVVKVLLQALSNTDYCWEVVNRKDQDGNIALHIAARNNQPQILKLLLNYKADKHATNRTGLTAMKVAEQLGHRESIGILLGSFIPGFTPCLQKLQRGILKYERKASTVIFKGMDNISSDDRNALLVILALLLTSTYQSIVSPLGGVWQDNGSSSSNSTSIDPVQNDHSVGKSVMYVGPFLYFYIPTCVVFMVTFFLTLGLLKPYPRGFRNVLQVLLTLLAMCFLQALSTICPTGFVVRVVNLFTLLLFILMMLMCVAYRVSSISVFILGCWSPTGIPVIDILLYIILGLWLFYFLCNELLKGIFLLIVYCLIMYITFSLYPFGSIIAVGCCCFVKFCQLCIKRYNVCRFR